MQKVRWRFRILLTLLFALALGVSSGRADTVHTKTRSISEVGDGIYVIRHQDTIGAVRM